MQDMLQSIQRSVLDATRTAISLPRQEDLDFERTLDRKLAKRSDACAALAVRLLDQLLLYANVDASPVDEGRVLDEYAHRLIHPVDTLLERVDHSLDRHAGREPAQAAVETRREGLETSFDVIVKPQQRFHRAVDNSDAPWVPLLADKPHALTPLDTSLQTITVTDDEGQEIQILGVQHPYSDEIAAALAIALPPPVEPFGDAIAKDSFASRTCTLVDNDESFRAMLDDLRCCRELAVDLEHHDYRSYAGITCLMQISSRSADYIVDVLNPAVRESSQALNALFADPSVVKVLHGAERDVIWLQRDLGLYIVNLFDTYHAACVMQTPKRSLAWLLQHYAGFTADKSLQTADWRVRPLPADMVHYARADTHFLLYIYDCIRRDLDAAALVDVRAKSAITAARVHYRRPVEEDERWHRLLVRWHKDVEWQPESANYRAFRALYAFRDRKARELDESVHYVLSNAMLLSLSQQLPVEADKAKLLLRGAKTARAMAAEIADIIAAVTSDTTDSGIAQSKEPHKVQQDVVGSHVRFDLTRPALAWPVYGVQSAGRPTLEATHSALISPPFRAVGSRAAGLEEVATQLTLSHPTEIPSRQHERQPAEVVGATKSAPHDHRFRAPATEKPTDSDGSDVIVPGELTNRGTKRPSPGPPHRNLAVVAPHDFAQEVSLLDTATAPARKRHKGGNRAGGRKGGNLTRS